MKSTEIGYDAGKYWSDRGEAETAGKFRQAFAAFVQGMSMKEIADSLGISYDTLRNKAQPTNDDWPSARQQLILARVEHRVSLVDKIEQQITRIKENREQNLAGAVKLRDVLMKIVDELAAGTLRVQKPFNTKMGIVLQEMNPTTGDLVNIATFARTIADLTYRALGDAPADSKQTAAGATSQGTTAPPGITVILPAVAVHPRPRRHQQAKITNVETVRSADEVRQSVSLECDKMSQPSAPLSTTPVPPGTTLQPAEDDQPGENDANHTADEP